MISAISLPSQSFNILGGAGAAKAAKYGGKYSLNLIHYRVQLAIYYFLCEIKLMLSKIVIKDYPPADTAPIAVSLCVFFLITE